MGVEEQQAGDVLLAGRELDRAAVEVGLSGLVDRRARLLALVRRRLVGRDPRLHPELAVEHGQAGAERLVEEWAELLFVVRHQDRLRRRGGRPVGGTLELAG